MVHKSDYTDDGIPLVNPTNIKGQHIVAENICKVTQTKYEELSAYVLSENDIVLARRGDLSKCAIVNKEHRGWLAGTGSFFLHILGVSLDFFIMLYTSPYAQDYLIGDSVGTTMNNLNQGLLSRMLIPIPPLFEQSRILEHYRFIMPIIEQYTVAYSERKALDNVLPLQIKKSVLQEAIQGKLVPQNPKEESASLLLQHIKEEKKRLVKEGKLKKKDVIDSTIFRGDDNKYYEQIGHEIVDVSDEIPFDLPNSWQWSRLGQIVRISIGKTPARGDVRYWSNATKPWVSISDMADYSHIKTTKERISDTAASTLMGAISPRGSLLMSFKLTVGRTSILDIEAYHNEAIISIYPYIDEEYALRDFLFYSLPILANMGDSKDAIKGKTLNSKSLNGLLIPLPPLKEQRHIIQRLEELYAHL